MFSRFSFPFCNLYEASETDARHNWNADFYDTRGTRILQDRDTGNRSPGIIPRKALSSKHLLLLTEEIPCTSLKATKKLRDTNRSGTLGFMPIIILRLPRWHVFDIFLSTSDRYRQILGSLLFQTFVNINFELGILLS